MLLALPLALLACSVITEPVCGCSPPGGGTVVVTGVVSAPDEAAVPGARVYMSVLNDGTCAEVPVTMTRSAEAGEGGRYRLTNSWGRAPDKCFRVWAEAPQGSALAPSEPRLLRVNFGLDAVVPDSVAIDFRLR